MGSNCAGTCRGEINKEAETEFITTEPEEKVPREHSLATKS